MTAYTIQRLLTEKEEAVDLLLDAELTIGKLQTALQNACEIGIRTLDKLNSDDAEWLVETRQKLQQLHALAWGAEK